MAASILPLADVVIVNRQEAKELNNLLSPPILITTLGADGCEVRVGDEITKVEAPSVEVVDSTGAGDAFVGAFSVAFVDTNDSVAAALIAVRAEERRRSAKSARSRACRDGSILTTYESTLSSICPLLISPALQHHQNNH